MEVLIMIAQLILGLSILVGVHEWGHMIAAKSFGMRVEKFSIGFPPKVFSKKIGETEYSIGAIPLGGFVKISGMIDESLDTDSLKKDPEPHEFRAKPAWQRLIVMLGGIIVNVILGVVIFIGLAYKNGETILPKKELNKHGIFAYELGKQLGFQTGDRVENINGRDFSKFSDLFNSEVLLGSDSYYTIRRNNESLKIAIPNDLIEKFADKKPSIIEPRLPFSVGKVEKGGSAAKSGLLTGDRFVSVNSHKISYFDEFKSAVRQHKNEMVTCRVLRNKDTLNLEIMVSETGTLGFYQVPEVQYTTKKYTLNESLTKGSNQAFSVVWLNILGFSKIFRGELSPTKSLSGPIKIATMFGGNWNWNRFFYLVGLLSMVLAFMNLLPIPALDGGHVMFLTWEIISGRKPSEKFLEGAQKVGMIFLISLMLFVIINDTLSLF